ncbi:hypothetical protein GGS23DRAFT_487498 [Durotheca rogersii]|uniref:uncharacterized protein n=1 Tax=Durotheca rogersii TaxID=419775 RepID=UPI00221F314D|nr:uncharacterized protein GGS23DRAFT_487498 [Durotheca rogersii]KAI5864205.1 hypothetical protein GGS23DRAFT_487498 [Durotheca rogersii]
MSANNDNAMTRFLFAILRQKNLKDIDWNTVAHDPILAQEITNGHAARMRYSRFRSAMLGLEPTRRNRTGPPKSRVSKSKKDPKGKKDEAIKSELAPQRPPTPPPLPESVLRKIKQETPQLSLEPRLTPARTPAPASLASLPNTPGLMSAAAEMPSRFLTPCSDLDLFAPAGALPPSPGSDLAGAPPPPPAFDFHGLSACPEHADPVWPHSPLAPPCGPFAPAYPFDDYAGVLCEHPHVHPAQLHLGLPTQSIESDAEYADVKHEDWDQYHHH